MKKCKFNKRLSFYIADEVSNTERMIIENHLKECAECSFEFNELQNENNLILDFLANYHNEELPLALSTNLSTIPQRFNKATKLSKVFIKFSIAASLILSFSLGILMTNEITSSESSYEFSSNSLANLESLYSYAGE